MDFGNNIQEFFVKYRTHAGMGQADLARLLRVTPQYICNVENGRVPRPATLIARLMKFLDKKRQNHLDELLREATYSYTEKKIKERRLEHKTGA